MKSNIKSICLTYDFKSLFAKKGYSFFTKGIYNLNIIGIRTNNYNKITNKFDDVLVLDYDTNRRHERLLYDISTKPGLRPMLQPANAKGTAILVPGQYKGAYCIDLHQGKYKALCQRLKPVKVYRDNNKDNKFDLDKNTIEEGFFGINIHKANDRYIRETVDGYSAGCQAFNDPMAFKSFMNICEKAKSIYGNSFTYTLINEEDLI